MSLRWDKYIWSVRLAKTRSQASEALSKGKIKINQSNSKPSKEPKVGDTIQISHNSAIFSYKVIQLLDRRIGAKLVADYIIDTTPVEEIDKLKTYQLAQQSYRINGTGKPSKKDRRDIEDYQSDWE
jgi:ribosome-associated heat shock protein Hsp15